MSSPATSVDTQLTAPLAAAQRIVPVLEGMRPEQQMLALKFVREILGLSASGSETRATSPIQGQFAQLGSEPNIDVKSYTENKAPKSDQQFAAVVAYYYQHVAPLEQRRDYVDVTIMADSARLAKRKQAPRWSSTLNNARNSGFLNSAGDGRYKLSTVGENLVAMTLPSGEGSKQRTKPRQAKKPSKKTARR
jgi:hypothetical protein